VPLARGQQDFLKLDLPDHHFDGVFANAALHVPARRLPRVLLKNMLLHSRQGSGEHRPVDINALVEESLNLAYHGARAEKQGFTITLERSFDPAAGEVCKKVNIVGHIIGGAMQL
jgi:hypothetical protein